MLLRFHGGKGLASLGGVILAWSWKWFLVLLAAAIVIAFVTQYVCFVAPSISLVFPLCYYRVTGLLAGAVILLVPAVPIVMKHVENIVRIRQGTELRMRYIWDREGELRRTGRWPADSGGETPGS